MQHGFCIACGGQAKGVFRAKRDVALYDWSCKNRKCRMAWRGIWDGTPMCEVCGRPKVNVGAISGRWKDPSAAAEGRATVWVCGEPHDP